MTYQITMRGSDGIVIASDRREFLFPKSSEEGEGSVANIVTKIFLDSSGRYAWAFAGSKPSLLAASYMEREFENGVPDAEVERTLRNCGDRGWAAGASGPGESTVVLADGKTKTIMRALLAHQSTMVSIITDGRCFTGQNYSTASFFPLRFYSPEMSVVQLAKLAAYAIVMAGEMDAVLIGGLDIAMYRDSVGRFEFVDSGNYVNQVMELDCTIRNVFAD